MKTRHQIVISRTPTPRIRSTIQQRTPQITRVKLPDETPTRAPIAATVPIRPTAIPPLAVPLFG